MKELSERYGAHVIGKRTALARGLTAYHASLVDALGGPEAITPMQRTLVDIAVKNRLYLDACDAWCTALLVGGGPINASSRELNSILFKRSVKRTRGSSVP